MAGEADFAMRCAAGCFCLRREAATGTVASETGMAVTLAMLQLSPLPFVGAPLEVTAKDVAGLDIRDVLRMRRRLSRLTRLYRRFGWAGFQDQIRRDKDSNELSHEKRQWPRGILLRV